MSEPTLEQRLAQAVEDYRNLNPVDRALLDADQRRSFVRGQSGHDPGPDVLAEEVRRLRALVEVRESDYQILLRAAQQRGFRGVIDAIQAHPDPDAAVSQTEVRRRAIHTSLTGVRDVIPELQTRGEARTARGLRGLVSAVTDLSAVVFGKDFDPT